MKYDSIFTYADPFPDDKPLMPESEIIQHLDEIDQAVADDQAILIANALEEIMAIASPLIQSGDIKALKSLRFDDLSQRLQRPIAKAWIEGFESGQSDAQAEIKAALPAEDRARFALSDRQQSALDRLLNQDNETLAAVDAEQSVLQRALRISGGFADDLLNRVKGHLIDSIMPGDGGDPISRGELVQRVQDTLEVGERRAEMIARTETTNAYNAGRMTSFKRSRVVSHVRFLAILDSRTTDICRSRNGLIWEVDDPAINRPPMHPNCRSVLSPLMPDINPAHMELVTDPRRDPGRRSLAPLPKGWNP